MEYQSTKQSCCGSNSTLVAQTLLLIHLHRTATITFSGSGEMDNGHDSKLRFQALSAGSLTSQGVSVDMGDMGAVSMASA